MLQKENISKEIVLNNISQNKKAKQQNYITKCNEYFNIKNFGITAINHNIDNSEFNILILDKKEAMVNRLISFRRQSAMYEYKNFLDLDIRSSINRRKKLTTEFTVNVFRRIKNVSVNDIKVETELNKETSNKNKTSNNNSISNNNSNSNSNSLINNSNNDNTNNNNDSMPKMKINECEIETGNSNVNDKKFYSFRFFRNKEDDDDEENIKINKNNYNSFDVINEKKEKFIHY